MEQFADDREVIETTIRYSERYDAYTCISDDDKFWMIPSSQVNEYRAKFGLTANDAVVELVKFANVHEVGKDESNVVKSMREAIDVIENEVRNELGLSD